MLQMIVDKRPFGDDSDSGISQKMTRAKLNLVDLAGKQLIYLLLRLALMILQPPPHTSMRRAAFTRSLGNLL